MEYSSLEELNFSNFNTNKVTNMVSMFYKCSDQFQNKIRSEYKKILKKKHLMKKMKLKMIYNKQILNYLIIKK